MKNNGLSVAVYESLKNKIENGSLSPSESLREVHLANEYAVSRNTIKKALLMLERDTLVTTEQNKSAKVRAYSLDEVLEFLELRSVMEGFITRLACSFLTGNNLLKLEETLKEMRLFKEKRELVSYSENNQKFHQIIYDACPNNTATSLLVSLKRQMKKYNTKIILIPGRSDQSFAEHEAILDALKNKDCLSAENHMTQHVMNIREIFSRNFQLLL